ncbi:MAG TPA: alpha/beta hydrolase [Chloroflexota bacterium]
MNTTLEPSMISVFVNGLRLECLDWGTRGKPPVLLLHGLAVFAHAWDQTSAALADDLHVVALDQRGHGGSDHARCEDYRTAVYGSDIIGAADALGWRRFSMVGEAMGGHNAMYVAATHPERIDRLVISDMEPVMRLQLIAAMRGAEGLPEYDSMDDVIAEATARDPHPSADAQRARAEHSVRQLASGRLTPKYDLNAARCWDALDLWPDLSSISCPTLLVRGEESTALRPEVAERMMGAIPDCQYAEITGAGDTVGLDNPSDFDAAVRSFLMEAR